jgi:hypothetical protein
MVRLQIKKDRFQPIQFHRGKPVIGVNELPHREGHLLDQAAHAAVKKKGSHFQSVFLRFVPKLEYKGAIWAVAHRIARVIWLILHLGVTYIEQGEDAGPKAKKPRAQKLIKAYKKLGYGVTISPINPQLADQPEG